MPVAKDECIETPDATDASSLVFGCNGRNGYVIYYSDNACKNQKYMVALNSSHDDFQCGSKENTCQTVEVEMTKFKGSRTCGENIVTYTEQYEKSFHYFKLVNTFKCLPTTTSGYFFINQTTTPSGWTFAHWRKISLPLYGLYQFNQNNDNKVLIQLFNDRNCSDPNYPKFPNKTTTSKLEKDLNECVYEFGDVSFELRINSQIAPIEVSNADNQINSYREPSSCREPNLCRQPNSFICTQPK